MMNKEQSLQLKGVAILMMLWLHLFNTAERVGECTTYINFFNGKPLVFALARVCGMCVPIYLFISGYGMAKAQDLGSRSTLRRLWRVYSRYWLVFAVFIPLACWIRPEVYPGSWSALFLNFLSLDVSYNGEWWFLFPWVLLIVASRWIVSFVRSNQRWINLLIFIVLFALLIDYKRPLTLFGDNIFALQLSWLLKVMPAFFVGVCAGCNAERWPKLSSWNWPSLVILVLVLLRMFLGPSLVNLLFAVPFIMLFTQCRQPQWLHAVLAFFGRYSIYIWLTHTFYAYYLFHDQLYAMKYPLLMYIVLLVVSLATAMVLEKLAKLIPEL